VTAAQGGGWHMLTVVGRDRPGIVARVTAALYEGGCNLGEASMMRLGDAFTIMLMVATDRPSGAVLALVAPVAAELDLRCHVDAIDSLGGTLHRHLEPEVRISVYGADRAGIVAEVTGALAAAGLNIVDLSSAVAGTAERPIYILQIEGQALRGYEALAEAVAALPAKAKVDVQLVPVDTLVG